MDNLTNDDNNNMLENVFKCLICETFTTGIVPFQEHLTGSKHQKKLKTINLIKSLEPNDIERSEDINIDVAFPFVCRTCNKKFTGKESLKEHLNSANHLKKMAINPQSGNILENYIDDAFPFACKTCAKNFTGKESFDQHLNSAKHLKKSQNLQKPIEETFPFACDTCDKKFTGEEPYEQHLASALHLRKAITKTLSETESESSVPDLPYQQHLESAMHAGKANLDPSEVFSCSECELTFSGSIPRKRHMESLKHEMTIVGPEKAKVLKIRHQLEHFKGGHQPEDIPCIRVGESFGVNNFPFTWECDEAEELAQKEFLAGMGIIV